MLLIFALLMFVIFIRLGIVAFRFAWGALAVLGVLVILPIVLLTLAIVGLAYFAWPILIVIGIITLINMVTKKRTYEKL